MYVKGKNDIEITYKYNEEGIRVEKSIKNLSNNQVPTTTYKLQGNKVIEEKTNNNTIHYYYDVNNSLIGFKYNNKNYFYQKTILNDIMGIVNEERTTVVKYEYDAYGNITNIEDTSGINIGNINSYKYKDYYYDTESSYYYLTSRYYNPEVRRFINADGYVSTGTGVLGYNMYAYVNNSPILYFDESGESAAIALGGTALGGFAVGTLSSFGLLAIGAIAVVVLVDQTINQSKVSTFDKANTTSEKQKKDRDKTIIYREGSSTYRNFTPRLEKDTLKSPDKTPGLSYTAFPLPGNKYQATTIGAIEAGGNLRVVQDKKNPTHYLIQPTNGDLIGWALSRDLSDISPHPNSIYLKSISWEVRK